MILTYSCVHYVCVISDTSHSQNGDENNKSPISHEKYAEQPSTEKRVLRARQPLHQPRQMVQQSSTPPLMERLKDFNATPARYHTRSQSKCLSAYYVMSSIV